MRLTLDELRVAEVAARNWKAGERGPTTNDGRDCPQQTLLDYLEPGLTWGERAFKRDSLSEIYAYGSGLCDSEHRGPREFGPLFIGGVYAGPQFVSAVLATIIRCAEMTQESEKRGLFRERIVSLPERTGDLRHDLPNLVEQRSGFAKEAHVLTQAP